MKHEAVEITGEIGIKPVFVPTEIPVDYCCSTNRILVGEIQTQRAENQLYASVSQAAL